MTTTTEPAGNPFAELIDPESRPWVSGGNGTWFKMLRVSAETGAWSALIRAEAGTVNAPHRHLGPADFYVISGTMDYRGGRASAGQWVYEPAGAVHDATSHPEETVYLANVHGPIAFHGPDGEVVSVVDGPAMQALLAAGVT